SGSFVGFPDGPGGCERETGRPTMRVGRGHSRRGCANVVCKTERRAMTRKWLYWTTPLVLTVAACETDRTGEDGQFGDTSETTRAIDRPGETTDIGDRLGEGMRRTGEQVGEGARQTGERVTDTARETATDVRRQFGGGDEQQERPGAART